MNRLFDALYYLAGAGVFAVLLAAGLISWRGRAKRDADNPWRRHCQVNRRNRRP